MNRWRLEWLRLWRTGRGAALMAVFVVFGFVGPVVARYLPDLISGADEDITIIVPPPKPADGMEGYLQNVQELGIVVLVIVAASALALDARPGLSAFYRTRVGHLRALVLSRYVVVAAAGSVSFVLGVLAAWYETAILLGPVPASRVLLGAGLECLYLSFAVAVTALAASLARSVLATTVVTLVVLLLFAGLGALPSVEEWSPAALSGAPSELLGQAAPGDYVFPALFTVIAVPALLSVATFGFGRREI